MSLARKYPANDEKNNDLKKNALKIEDSELKLKIVPTIRYWSINDRVALFSGEVMF